MLDNFHRCVHPLILHKLSYLRQPRDFIHFRDYESLIYELGLLLGYEASRDHLETVPFEVENRTSRYRPKDPNTTWRHGFHIAPRPVIVPIVRSGLVMAQAMRSIIPTAYMGHIGLFSEPKTGEPKEFMVTMPPDYLDRKFFVVDLFIERAKTAVKALDILLDCGVEAQDIIFIALIISPQGKASLAAQTRFRDVQFYCARIDGSNAPNDPENWLEDYQDTNHRLFRTRNHKLLLGDPERQNDA